MGNQLPASSRLPQKIRLIAYSIEAAEDENESAEIRIYDDIGDTFFSEGVTAKSFADDLAELGPIKFLNVRINSAGGNVFDGNAIYNSIRRHPAKVTVDIDGLALSAASVIAMAGDHVRMAENAVMMIHDPTTLTVGDAEAHRKAVDTLDRMRDTLVTAYRNQTGKSKVAIKKLMDAETWFSADQAKAEGFVDEVANELAVAAAYDPAVCRHEPPEWAVKRMAEVKGAVRFVEAGDTVEAEPVADSQYPYRWLDARRRLTRVMVDV